MRIYNKNNCNLKNKFQVVLDLSDDEFEEFWKDDDWLEYEYIGSNDYLTMTKESIKELVLKFKNKKWSNEDILFNLPATYLLDYDRLKEVLYEN